jgi:type II secretory pathway pseudopilin PulG
LSVLGTGIAAAVAQTGLQSQQVARQRDKRENNRTRQAQRDTEVFETRLIGLEEHDGDEQATRLHVDNQQPDPEHAEYDKPDSQTPDAPQPNPPADGTPSTLPDADTLLRQLAATADPAIQRKATAASAPGSPRSTDPDALYAHIDIQA